MNEYITSGIAQGAGNILDFGLGQITANQQYQRQKKLMDIQFKNQKQLNEQGQQLQMKTWNETNYEAQRAHIENAGLNVGLMYGGSGAGGATTGSQSGGSAGMGNVQQAPTGKGMDLGALNLQAKQVESAIDLNKALANKANAEANRTSGSQTQLDLANVGSLGQGVQESIAKVALTKVQTEISDLDRQLSDRTLETRVLNVGALYNKALGEAQSAMAKGSIDKETRETQINIIKLNYGLLEAQKASIEAGTELTKEQKELIGKEIEYYQDKFKLDSRRVGAQEAYTKNQKEFQDSLITQGYWKLGADAAGKVADIVFGKIPTSTENTSTTASYDEHGNYKGESHTTSKQTKK